MDRRGIISAGTWLVDNVKIIEQYPARGNLTTISRVEKGLGGCSHNVLADLAGLGTDLPLYAGGCIGRDALGDYVQREIARLGIDGHNMLVLPDAATSYTDVMSERDGGIRTFFHFRGANARLGAEQVLQMETQARIFHLGYLLLLDELDSPDPEYGVVAARVLKGLQRQGYETSVDVVSEEGDRFRRVVEPCLPYIDYLIVNEIEAGAVCGLQLRDPEGVLLHDRMEEAAETLVQRGVGRLCAIHCPEGGYARTRDGESLVVQLRSGRREANHLIGRRGRRLLRRDALCPARRDARCTTPSASPMPRPASTSSAPPARAAPPLWDN